MQRNLLHTRQGCCYSQPRANLLAPEGIPRALTGMHSVHGPSMCEEQGIGMAWPLWALWAAPSSSRSLREAGRCAKSFQSHHMSYLVDGS